MQREEGKGKASLGEAGGKISQVKTGITVGTQKLSGDKRLQKSSRVSGGHCSTHLPQAASNPRLPTGNSMRPFQAGKCHAGSTSAEQPHPTPPSPSLEEQSISVRNVHPGQGQPGPGGRRWMLIWGLIKARLDYKGWRCCNQVPVTRACQALEVMLKVRSLVDLSATGLAPCPGPPGSWPQPFPHHTSSST